MIVSQTYNHSEQQVLWPWVTDRPLVNMAATRCHIGRFFEEVTRIVTGARRHVTDSRADICPDLSHGTHRMIEVKSMSKELILFKHRLDKAVKYQDDTFGSSYTYLIWEHRSELAQVKNLHRLWEVVADGTVAAWAIPQEKLVKWCRRQKTVNLEYNQKCERKPCWRIPIRVVKELATGATSLHKIVKVHNHFCSFDMHGDLEHLYPEITVEQQELATNLLNELITCHPLVELEAAPRQMHIGHKIRVVKMTNPRWYLDLCAQYPNKRNSPRRFNSKAPDTDIRRRFAIRALERLSHGVCRYEYDWRFRPLLSGN